MREEPEFEASDQHFETRVRESFDRQAVMALIEAELARVAPGMVDVVLPFRAELTQQHGYLHAGIVTAAVDNACGYAALSLLRADKDVLTIEYKVNFVAPARGRRLFARGRVVRPGRTIMVCAGDAFMDADENEQEQLVATMLATIMVLPRKVD